MSRVVLFDIDGTLIRSGGAAVRALERAAAHALGRDDVKAEFSFAGMTDRAIFRGLLRSLTGKNDNALIERALDAYPELLREEMARAAEFRVLPGIVAALEILRGLDGLSLGLGTGNIEVGARIKLERAKLNHYFSFGGFGSDAEERAALLLAGAKRGAERLGRPLTDCRVLVVGDTPLDVHAAHAIGAPCLGVATGGASAAQLVDAGAEHVFANLTEPGALEVLLEG